MTISSGDVSVFFTHPIAAFLLACAAISIGASVWAKRRPRVLLHAAEKQAAEV